MLAFLMADISIRDGFSLWRKEWSHYDVDDRSR